jgi:hypothetical protein
MRSVRQDWFTAHILSKIMIGFIAVVMLVSILFTGFSSCTVYAQDNPNGKNNYLPMVLNRYQRETPKMLGIIAQGYWGANTNDIQSKLNSLDTWAGKKHSIVGWFFDIVAESRSQQGTDYNFKGQLENLWVNGYVSFVNLGAAGATAAEIANGNYDANIYNLARSYAAFVAAGGGRKAFIAPLQEMNGYWVSYGNDPAGYKAAYAHIQSIFASQGIDASEIWWTFAPNGWSEDWNGFELYYPGDDKVDVVSYSSYNYGYCPVGDARWRKWADYSLVHQPYVERMRQMAPNKPIIVAQTATTAQYPSSGVYNISMKNTWLIDTYNYLAEQPGVLAILYFDVNKEAVGECDNEIFNGLNHYNGYITAISNAKYAYYDPARLSQMNLMGTP